MSVAPDPARADERARAARGPGGLCPQCEHVKVVTSAKGSTFFLCQLSATDPRFPKYPPQPVLRCNGFAPRG